MSEKHLVGHLYYEEGGFNQGVYGVSVVVRNQIGQGWGFDLNHIEPDDLRVLADFLEKRKKDNKTT